jgi:hypothetical protein
MRWRYTLTIVAATLLLASCGRLGLGIPECEPVVQNPTAAMILSAQAVPTAEYAPCINSLQLGWDNLDFEVESGKAGFSITRAIEPFFTATLTETCDIGDSTPVPHPLVEKYESIHSIGSDIKVTIIPSGTETGMAIPLIRARTLAEELTGVRVDGRRVLFTVDPDTTLTVRTRVNRALMTSQFIWIINEFNVSDGTLELRRTPEGEGERGLSVDEAMLRIEELAPEVVYEGNWYFVFKGGCITYEFDAQGTVAETVAEDVVASLGFYPLAELRQLGRENDFDVVVPENG